MRLVAPTVWTNRRKWMGNLIPALVWLPFSVAGLYLMVQSQQVVGPGLALLAIATVAGWIMVNQFGLFENTRMKRQLQLMLAAKGVDLAEGPFVGIATPKYSSMLDPHQDVGYLRLFDDRLSFVSESQNLDLAKEHINKIRFRPNVHSVLGLGRWVSVEGAADGKPVRLLIEPRERRTLLGNLRYSSLLAQRLQRWLRETANDA